MASPSPMLVLRHAASETLVGIVRLPSWWYTRGLGMAFGWLRGSISSASRFLGLGVWTKNLFVPMYGETAWSGRLISFFIRLFMIAVRGAGVLVWTILMVIFFALYLIILPVSALSAFYHLGGLLVS